MDINNLCPVCGCDLEIWKETFPNEPEHYCPEKAFEFCRFIGVNPQGDLIYKAGNVWVITDPLGNFLTGRHV